MSDGNYIINEPGYRVATFNSVTEMADFIFSHQSEHVVITVCEHKPRFVVYLDDYSHQFEVGNQEFFAEVGVNRLGDDIHEIYHIGELTPSQRRILEEIEAEVLFWGEVRYIKIDG